VPTLLRLRRDETCLPHVKERRKQLPLRQVSGRSEDHENAGLRMVSVLPALLDRPQRRRHSHIDLPWFFRARVDRTEPYAIPVHPFGVRTAFSKTSNLQTIRCEGEIFVIARDILCRFESDAFRLWEDQTATLLSWLRFSKPRVL
jgi:hypothetical protein